MTSIEQKLRVMELERDNDLARIKHEGHIAKAQLMEQALNTAVRLYVGMLTAPLRALAHLPPSRTAG